MKKILSIFAVVSLLAVLVLPAVSLAANPPETLKEGCNIASTDPVVGKSFGGETCNVVTNNTGTGLCCMMNTVFVVTNWVFYVLTLVAVIMIIFGGFTYITSAGDPTKAGKGKSMLTYAIIGLAIALVAKLVPSLVRFIVGA